MTCWKWFGSVLKEAGVEVTDKNQKKVDDVIHHYIGVSSTRGGVSRKTSFSFLVWVASFLFQSLGIDSYDARAGNTQALTSCGILLAVRVLSS